MHEHQLSAYMLDDSDNVEVAVCHCGGKTFGLDQL